MAAGITGLISGFYGSDSQIYGTKPIVPEAPDYAAALKKFIGFDISELGDVGKLASGSTSLFKSLIETAHPGSTAIEAGRASDIQSLLKGDLPGLDAWVKRRGGEAAVTSGTIGSSFGFGQELDIGFQKKLGLIESGLQASERWAAQQEQGVFDFSKMFFGPQEAIKQADSQFSRDWLAAQVAAAPDPESRGAFDSEMSLVGMALSAYSGGAGYQNTYRQNYNGGGLSNYQQSGANGSSYFDQGGQNNDVYMEMQRQFDAGQGVDDAGAGMEGLA